MPPTTTPPRRGGRRPGAGRPPAYTEPLLRKSVTLPGSYVEQLSLIGNGNLSDGLRFVLEYAHTPSGSFWLNVPVPVAHADGGRFCPQCGAVAWARPPARRP